MSMKAMFLIAILAFSFLTLSFDNVSADPLPGNILVTTHFQDTGNKFMADKLSN